MSRKPRRLRKRDGSLPVGDEQIIQVDMSAYDIGGRKGHGPHGEWNGRWWAESLDGKEATQYIDLRSKLERAKSPAKRQEIARAIFQMGHDHGYELRRDLEWED